MNEQYHDGLPDSLELTTRPMTPQELAAFNKAFGVQADLVYIDRGEIDDLTTGNSLPAQRRHDCTPCLKTTIKCSVRHGDSKIVSYSVSSIRMSYRAGNHD